MSIGYCRPTRDHPTHARYAVVLFFNIAETIFDTSARNESHVGILQIEKMIWAKNNEFCFLLNVDTIMPGIIILRPEMGSTPQN